jgi:transposase
LDGGWFVSLELSRSTWVATSLAPGSKKMSKHTLVGGDGRKLLDLLARLKTRAEQRAHPASGFSDREKLT